MKRYISLFIILIFMLSHTFTAHSSETVSTVSEEAFLNAYEKAELPFVDEDVYLADESGCMFFDNALTDDMITSSIIDFDIMFPEGSGNYLSMRVYESESESFEVFRITPFAVALKAEGISALGIEGASGDIELTNDYTGAFKFAYDRWNKTRLTFSSTNNKTGIWHSSSEAKYTIKDAKPHAFASAGAYRVSLHMGYDSSLGADTGVYMKNATAYTAYLNATSQQEREALADRTGKYRYRYDDGSGDFLYDIVTDDATNTGYAVITGLDPNKCTKEIEDPVCFDYTLPAYADGYPVRAIGKSAFEGLSGMERFDIPSCITMIQRKAFAESSFDTLIFRGDAELCADVFAGADVGELVFLGDIKLNDNPFDAQSELACFSKGVKVMDKTYNGSIQLRNASYDTSFAFENKNGSLSWVFGDHTGFVAEIPYEASYIDDYDTVNIRYYSEIPGQKIKLLVNEYNTFLSSADNSYYNTNLVTEKGWNTFNVRLADVKTKWSIETPEYLYVYFISGWGLTTGTKEEFEAGKVDAISGEKMYVDSIWLDGVTGKNEVADFGVGAQIYDHAGVCLSRALLDTTVAHKNKLSSLAWTFNDTNGLILKLPFDEKHKTGYESLVIRYYSRIPGQTFGIGVNETDHWGSQTINKYLLKNARVSGKWEEYRISIPEIMTKWDDETSEHLYLNLDSKWFGTTAVSKEDFDSSKMQAIIGEKLYIDSIWLEKSETDSESDTVITPAPPGSASGIKHIYANSKVQDEFKKCLIGYGAFSSIWIDLKNSMGYMTENTDAEMLVVLESNDEPYEIQVSHEKVDPTENGEGCKTFRIDMTAVGTCTKKIYIWDSIRGMKPLVPSVVIPSQ